MTITGADDSVDPNDLAAISKDFPFVEWGILFSKKRQGQMPRYPSYDWLAKLYLATRKYFVRTSAHLCGDHVPHFMGGLGDDGEGFGEAPLKDHLKEFNRIQLNGFGDLHPPPGMRLPEHFIYKLSEKEGPQVIIQIGDGKTHKMAGAMALVFGNRVAALYDRSGGEGIPIGGMLPEPPTETIFMAYAGGVSALNARNLVQQIISESFSLSRFENFFGLDMETNARSTDDKTFDLKKCVAVLESVAPLVMK